jgi:hypothetical protein
MGGWEVSAPKLTWFPCHVADGKVIAWWWTLPAAPTALHTAAAAEASKGRSQVADWKKPLEAMASKVALDEALTGKMAKERRDERHLGKADEVDAFVSYLRSLPSDDARKCAILEIHVEFCPDCGGSGGIGCTCMRDE